MIPLLAISRFFGVHCTVIVVFQAPRHIRSNDHTRVFPSW